MSSPTAKQSAAMELYCELLDESNARLLCIERGLNGQFNLHPNKIMTALETLHPKFYPVLHSKGPWARPFSYPRTRADLLKRRFVCTPQKEWRSAAQRQRKEAAHR
jgi:hypothetical protein